MPLLTTKLHIPSVAHNLVPRPRLVELLDAGLGEESFARKLTLVSAPAGFGKTTLLGEWASSRGSSGRIAWLSLDQGDNDPARFIAYLLAAVQMDGENLAESVSRGSQSFSPERILTSLINQINTLPDLLILCLDDYHLITAQPIHDALTFLLDHQPGNLHLVIATRSDPPLPLARLRARGHLIELRQTDLRFTEEEAVTFLKGIFGLDLSPVDIAALEARTEGWIAGLQMAALAMQGTAAREWQPTQGAGRSLSGFIQAFTGSHRFILDYLMEEVLDQQPHTIQEFLLKTSILERLTGPLCDAILDNDATGQQILENIERANLFLVPLDEERRWYRYHRLFSDLLHKRLRQTYPDIVPTLHYRASEWHEQQGLRAAAIDHALAAESPERAVALIEESAEATFMRSEVATFVHWVERLPDELVRTRPILCFFHAWALLMSGRSLDAVRQRLEDMASDQDAAECDDVTIGRVAALRAYMMLFQADTRGAAELCRRAMERLPESDLFLRSIVTWILSLTRVAEGNLEDGKQALEEVARRGQATGNRLIAVAALCHQAELQARQGRLYQARETLERTLLWATDSQGRRLPIASKALIGLGELEREWNDLDAALEHLTEGIELAKQWSELAAFDACFPLMRVRLAQGDVEAAREAMEAAREIADRSRATEIDDIVADLQQAHFCITQGDIAGAVRWAETWGLVPGVSPEPRPGLDEGQDLVRARLRKYEHLVLARLFILQNRAAEALDLLETLLAQARQLGRIDLTIEIQILKALACQMDGQDAQAMDALAETLSLAEPGGYLRIFLDEGKPVAELLRQAASQGVAPAYVAKLLAAFGGPELVQVEAEPSQPHAHPLIEPLSEREMEVLRLLANGMSNPEIAGELYIAVSTVRSHCKSIYGKLDVHKRWDAVQRAQALDLI